MPNGKSSDKTRTYHSGDEDFEFSEGDSASGHTGPFPRGVYRPGAGIENPAFMPDLDPMAPVQIPPWLAEGEGAAVAPSQRAQAGLPWTPSNLRRLAPLRISTRSSDSFILADTPQSSSSSRSSEDLPPPPSPPPYH
uniref:Uncharacterized protein n=1 Tax=Knipowitschia caucasica TaxID=637954 RepID=A0AAV2K613_KNICA